MLFRSLDQTTRVVEFNDLVGMEKALAHGDVAAILMEPAMTNVGIVLPEAGYLNGVAELARKYSAKLIIDETHTISAGPGGMTAQLGLKPDFLTIGKAIGGGIPTGTFGMTHEIAAEIARKVDREVVDTGGIGGSLNYRSIIIQGNIRLHIYLRIHRNIISHLFTDWLRHRYQSRLKNGRSKSGCQRSSIYRQVHVCTISICLL